MRRTTALLLTLIAAVALAGVPAGGAAPPRIVAIGDIHGAYEAFTGMLRATGLIDEQNRWIGGKAVLVQTGDLVDRGAGVKQVLDLVMALEAQASRAGGRVEVLLGNHEVMNLAGNTRDATDEIFAAFGGYGPYRQAFGPDGRYGRWLRSKPAAAVVEGTLFMHAGLSPDDPAKSVKDINQRVRADIKAWDDGVRWLERKKLVEPGAAMKEVITAAEAQVVAIQAKKDAGTLTDDDIQAARTLLPVVQILSSSLFAADGPMWFRGYATWTEGEGAPLAAALRKRLGVKRIVSGHSTVKSGRITARFDGTVFLIDTGTLGAPTYPTGRPSALEITGDTATAVYAGERVPLTSRGPRHPS